MGFTTWNGGHRHEWSLKRNLTSFTKSHKHKIDIPEKIALPIKKGGHTHRLL